jgi:hypothetical protein
LHNHPMFSFSFLSFPHVSRLPPCHPLIFLLFCSTSWQQKCMSAREMNAGDWMTQCSWPG